MELHEIVRKLMKDGKGVFGSDADIETLHARFRSAGIAPTENMRRAFRELLFSTPNVEQSISTVFLPEEAFQQSMSDGVLFPEFLVSKDILVGIALPEKTEDTISHHLQTFRSYGLSAARLRMRFDGKESVDAFSKRLAVCSEYIRASHAISVVPVIGIVLRDTTRSAAETEDMLIEACSLLADALSRDDSALNGIIIEVPMADASGDTPAPASREIAERTVRTLTTTIPEKIGGILLRSFETAPEKATENLNALARLEPFPWPIAFSFSRVLTDPVLAVWKGEEKNRMDAQALFIGRLALAQSADAGAYSTDLEKGTRGLL